MSVLKVGAVTTLRATKMTVLVAIVLLGIRLLPGPTPASASPALILYSGTTSQGGTWAAKLVKLPSGPAVRSLFVEIDLACSGGDVTLGTGFGSPIPQPLVDRRFTLDEVYPDEALRMDVSFGQPGASGTVTADLPTFAPTGGLETCSSGPVTLAGTKSAAAASRPATPPDLSTRFIRQADGSMTTILGRSSLPPPPPPPPPLRTRRYTGMTEQGGRVGFWTFPFRQHRRFEFSEYGLGLACDDGSSQIWFISSDAVLGSDHRFQTDNSDIFQVWREQGRLGAKKGSGTVEFALPEFTPDETLMRCGVGPLVWTVKRTTGDRAATATGGWSARATI